MVKACFRKENSKPPICGVHHVPLTQSKLPIDPYAPHLGQITVWICPVSGQVLVD
jgi:hypothetical protein